jgi:hypothetical protein
VNHVPQAASRADFFSSLLGGVNGRKGPKLKIELTVAVAAIGLILLSSLVFRPTTGGDQL